MMAKKKKIRAGLYTFEGWRIRSNDMGEYGFPRSAWIVSDPDFDEVGPIWTLKEAIEWIKSMISDSFEAR
jgi:hypothetical protein